MKTRNHIATQVHISTFHFPPNLSWPVIFVFDLIPPQLPVPVLKLWVYIYIYIYIFSFFLLEFCFRNPPLLGRLWWPWACRVHSLYVCYIISFDNVRNSLPQFEMGSRVCSRCVISVLIIYTFILLYVCNRRVISVINMIYFHFTLCLPQIGMLYQYSIVILLFQS